jgi:serine/threonine-protein kinase
MAKKKNQQIGRYKILGELGRGAMGVVYRARDPALDREVALKTINLVDDAEERKAYEKRFFQEAKAAGKLTHANIVTTYDFGEEEGVAYMAMELLDGTELRDREGGPCPRRRRWTSRGVADGLRLSLARRRAPRRAGLHRTAQRLGEGSLVRSVARMRTTAT